MFLSSYFPRMRADTILATRPMAAKAPSTTKSTQKTKSSLIIFNWSLVRFGQSNGSTSLSKVALISKSDMFDMVKLFCASASLKRIENVAIRQKLNKDYAWARFFSKVSPSSYLGGMEGLPGNSKPTYEVCESKSEKPFPMYFFEGTPFNLIFHLPGSWDCWGWPTLGLSEIKHYI